MRYPQTPKICIYNIFYHSTIFKTIEDGLGNTKLSINNGIIDFFNGNFFKKKYVISDDDINALKAYNTEIDHGVLPVTAYYRTMQNASDAAVNMAQSAGDATVNLEQIPKVSKIAAVGMKALSIADNIFATMAIFKGIELLTTTIINLINAEEKAKKATENFISSYELLQKNANSNKKSITDLQAEYKNLSKGVDSLGRSVSLTNEEYDSYKNLISQISEIMPNLAVRYNENGESIGFVKGKIDLKTEYEEYQKIQAKDIIANGFNDETSMKDVFKNASSIFVWDNEIAGQRSIITHNNLNEDELTDAEIKIQKYQDKIDLAVSGVQDALNVFALANGNFYKLTDDQQNYLTTFLSNINQGFISWQDLYTEDNARKYVNSLITGILKNKDGLADSIAELFSFDYDTTDLTPEEIKEKVNTIISKIAKALGIKDIGDLEISLGFEFVDDNANEYKDAVNKFKEMNDYGYISSTSKHNSDIDDFVKSNKITLEELEQLNEQGYNASTSINILTNALNTMREAKKTASTESPSTHTSFSKAWKALGTTGDEDQQKAETEAKEKLLELANAGKLTIGAFKDSSIATKFMKDTGLSADKATRKINKLVESTKQLSSMKTGITAITSAYDEKKDSKDKRVGSDTLKSLYETLGIDNSWSKKDLKVWEDYKNAATDASIPLKDFKKCQDDLATSYVNSNNFLANLTKDLGKLTENATKERQDYYDGLLTEMGITNAHQITTKLLADAKKYLGEQDDFAAEKGKKLSDASSEEIQNFIEVQGGVDNVSFALKKLAIEKESCNAHVLDFSGDCSNLISYVTAIGGTTKALGALQAAQNNDWKAVKEAGYDPKDTSSISKIEEDAKKEVEKAKKKLVKTNTNTTPGNKSDNSGKGKKGKDTDTKKTKQTFDWLERRISVLTDKLDFLRAKLENVFTVKKKNSIIDQEIKKTNKLIKTYQKQEKVYKKQANQSARSSKTQTGEKKSTLTGKKGKKIIKQIQNGQIKGSRKQLIKDYGEPTANAIEEYQDYWDKYQQARTNIQTARKDKRELKIQKHQNRVDYYDALSSKYDAQIENKATAKAKNKLEGKKIKSIQKSYNYQIKIAKLEKNSVKAATLLAQKWQEIAKAREQILQNTLDENANRRKYNDAAYENKDNAGKKQLIQSNISTYRSDNNAYQENINSARKDVNDANNAIKTASKSASSQLKKTSIDSKTIKKIKSYLSSGKAVPDQYLKMADTIAPKLYEKLTAYNTALNSASIAKDALTKAQDAQKLGVEESEASIREEQSKSIQLDIDAANNKQNQLTAEYDNLTTVEAKNSNIDSQLQQQAEIHLLNIAKIQNDITDSSERNVALAKEEAEWIRTQREQEILKLQNLSDEQSAQYALNQQKEANADTAKEKNKYEADSRKNLKAQYDYEIQIAEKKGDSTEADRQRLELAQKIEESYQKQIENIKKEYDLMIGMNDAEKSTIDSKIAALQANGYGIGTEVYVQQMALDRESYRKSLEEIKRISAEMPNLTGNALKQAEIELETEKQKVWGFQKALGEAQQTINDINLSKIERIGTYLEYDAENLEYIQNILSHSDFTMSDKDISGLTTEGLASIAVTFAQISNNSEQIGNIYDQIAEKRRQLEESEVKDGQLVAEIDDLIQKAHDMEEANYDFGESIKTTVIDSLNSLSDALDDNISKYKEALQTQKDLYDYRRKVANQLKSITSLEKQLAALQGSDTEEARARIQKLQIQLEDEQQNLKDMEYDKYIQDQEEMLDKVSEDFQDFIANVSSMSVSDICKAMRSTVSDNLGSIGTAIQNAFTESSKIGDIATSINGLSDVIKDLNFSGNVEAYVDENGNLKYRYTDDKNSKTDMTVDNTDTPGTITGLAVDGKDIPLADKDVARTEGDINEATDSGYIKNEFGIFIKGLDTLKRGESVLTPDQTEQFRKLTKNLVPLNTIAENIAALPGNLTPGNHSPATTTVRNVDIHLDGSNVVDADSFIKTLHNPRVLKEVSNGISSQIGGVMSNRLGNF